MKKKHDHSKLLVSCIIWLFILQSCGYRMTEEDKYPNMEVYPSTSNSNYSIDSLFEIKGKVKFSKQYLYAITKKKNEPKQLFLSILNKEMNIIKEIQLDAKSEDYIKYTIDENNSIYIVDDNNKLYKYIYPWNTKIELTKILDVTQKDSLKQVYASTIEENLSKDSLFYIGGFIDSINNSNIKKLYDINECVLPLNAYDTDFFVVLNDSLGRQSYAIIRDYSELWQSSYQNKKPQCDSLIHNYSFTNKTDSPNITLEQAALGNNSSGNHFVFGFTPYGYDYYKIIIDQDTINFKIENNNLNYPSFSQFGSSFTNKIILRDRNDVLYLVTKK